MVSCIAVVSPFCTGPSHHASQHLSHPKCTYDVFGTVAAMHSLRSGLTDYMHRARRYTARSLAECCVSADVMQVQRAALCAVDVLLPLKVCVCKATELSHAL